MATVILTINDDNGIAVNITAFPEATPESLSDAHKVASIAITAIRGAIGPEDETQTEDN